MGRMTAGGYEFIGITAEAPKPPPAGDKKAAQMYVTPKNYEPPGTAIKQGQPSAMPMGNSQKMTLLAIGAIALYLYYKR
jgi:hypothetical protein